MFRQENSRNRSGDWKGDVHVAHMLTAWTPSLR